MDLVHSYWASVELTTNRKTHKALRRPLAFHQKFSSSVTHCWRGRYLGIARWNFKMEPVRAKRILLKNFGVSDETSQCESGAFLSIWEINCENNNSIKTRGMGSLTRHHTMCLTAYLHLLHHETGSILGWGLLSFVMSCWVFTGIPRFCYTMELNK